MLGEFDRAYIGKETQNRQNNGSTKYRSSCFNAFSRVDVRVEVKIPGGVESYYVDVRGER
jgi:hypothetical protein